MAAHEGHASCAEALLDANAKTSKELATTTGEDSGRDSGVSIESQLDDLSVE